MLAPFGVTVPAPTLQAHTRNAPLRYLPLELSLRNVPGYERRAAAGMSVMGRADRVLARGDLRHDAPELRVHLGLGCHNVGDYRSPVLDDRRGGLVARCLDAQDFHGVPSGVSIPITLATVPPRMSARSASDRKSQWTLNWSIDCR